MLKSFEWPSIAAFLFDSNFLVSLVSLKVFDGVPRFLRAPSPSPLLYYAKALAKWRLGSALTGTFRLEDGGPTSADVNMHSLLEKQLKLCAFMMAKSRILCGANS